MKKQMDNFKWDENLIADFAIFYREEQGGIKYCGKDLMDVFKEIKSKELLQVPVETDLLVDFVNLLKNVKWESNLFVRFRWGTTDVVGKITIMPYEKQLQIMPCQIKSDIGAGAGQAIYITFPRKPISETNPSNTYTEPTEQDLESPEFNAIWNAIKKWDLDRGDKGTSQRCNYSGATGTDVMTILNALRLYPSRINELKTYRGVEMKPTQPTPTTDKQEGWEILSFKGVLFGEDNVLFKKTQKGFYAETKYKVTWFEEDELIKEKTISIHSVKRLSDSTVFSVGDMIEGAQLDKYNIVDHFPTKITGIRIINGTIGLAYGNVGEVIISHAKKIQPSPSTDTPVLFTTEDGVEIKKGDKYWAVILSVETVPDRVEWFVANGTENPTPESLTRIFSDEYKAKEYLLNSKPYLSINDIKSVYAADRQFVGCGWLIDQLLSKIKHRNAKYNTNA